MAVAACAFLCLAVRPAAGADPERWSIRPAALGPERTIVAERATAEGRQAWTLAARTGGVLAVPSIALDGAGGAGAVWVSEPPGGGTLVEGALFDGRGWGAPVRLSASPGRLGQPSLAADGRGGYWVAMTRDDGDGDDIALLRWSGGTVRAAGVFGEPGRPDVDPWLERSPEGEVRLVWTGYDGETCRRQERVVAPGGNPTPGGGGQPRRPEPPVTEFPEVAGPSSSRGAVAWSDGEGGGSAPTAGDPRELPDGPPDKGAGAPAVAAAAADPDLSRILGLGDSTTWGRGSTYMGPPTDYLTRLENQLRGPWTTRNAGRPGFTSTDLLRIVDAELNWRPGVTLLSIGINDAFVRHSASTVTYNLRTLVGKIRAAGGVAVLATTMPVIDDALRLDQHEYLANVVNPAIRAVAVDLHVPLVDLWGYFLGLPGWRSYIYAPHGNHLTDTGYELVATRFRLLLQKNDLQLPAKGTARGPLLADVRLGAWDLPVPGAITQGGNAGAVELLRDAVSPLADNGIVAAAPLDLDGDGVDGIAVVRARSGETSLTVYTVPPAGTFAEPDILAAVTVEAQAGWLPRVCACPPGEARSRRAITHLFAIDQDGDGRDEFGFVCARTCTPTGSAPVERQVVEIWRGNQPGGAPPERLVLDEWRLPGTGWIHDIAAAQVDADPEQEVLVLAQSPRVSALHKLGLANPDAIRLLDSGRYGRLFDCATDPLPEGWNICDRWERRGRAGCGLVEIRSLTPRAVLYDTPPSGADTKGENSEPLLYSWWFAESPLLAAACADTGEEWTERTSDVLGLAAADVSQPPDGRDEVLVLRLRTAVDALEAWSLPPLPASGAEPTLVALDRWVRVGSSDQYLLKAASIPDGLGGAKPAVVLWLNRRN